MKTKTKAENKKRKSKSVFILQQTENGNIGRRQRNFRLNALQSFAEMKRFFVERARSQFTCAHLSCDIII